jgi:hypothetical protein
MHHNVSSLKSRANKNIEKYTLDPVATCYNINISLVLKISSQKKRNESPNHGQNAHSCKHENLSWIGSPPSTLKNHLEQVFTAAPLMLNM